MPKLASDGYTKTIDQCCAEHLIGCQWPICIQLETHVHTEHETCYGHEFPIPQINPPSGVASEGEQYLE